MVAWLVCKVCDVKEWVTVMTEFDPCHECGSARYAEDDDGKPLVVWSEQQDPTNWNAKE